jgi:hypothetical protein
MPGANAGTSALASPREFCASPSCDAALQMVQTKAALPNAFAVAKLVTIGYGGLCMGNPPTKPNDVLYFVITL